LALFAHGDGLGAAGAEARGAEGDELWASSNERMPPEALTCYGAGGVGSHKFDVVLGGAGGLHAAAALL
jgi:hypothetical protein